MAKLTDLPDEILTLIFRKFLSNTLTKHPYLCEWNINHSDIANRANLCRLALVSKAFNELAMPLLFEQLFSSRDVAKIGQTQHSLRVGLEYAHHTRYAEVTLGLESGQQTSPVLSFMSGCTQLKHLRLIACGGASNVGEHFSAIIGIAQKSELRSLWIGLDLSAHTISALQHISLVTSLTGLRFTTVQQHFFEPPQRQLQQLKALEIAFGQSSGTSNAILALACPDTIEEAALNAFLGVSSAGSPVYALSKLHLWSKMHTLHVYISEEEGSNRYIDLSNCPALRNLTFEPHTESVVAYDRSLSTISSPLSHLSLRYVSETELANILRSAHRRDWLGKGLRRFHVDIGDLLAHGTSSTTVKVQLLQLAGLAEADLHARGVQLDPPNLVEIIGQIRMQA